MSMLLLHAQMIQLQAAPYRLASDDYLAVASSFSLLMVCAEDD
jgi:hypothetical protein